MFNFGEALEFDLLKHDLVDIHAAKKLILIRGWTEFKLSALVRLLCALGGPHFSVNCQLIYQFGYQKKLVL